MYFIRCWHELSGYVYWSNDGWSVDITIAIKFPRKPSVLPPYNEDFHTAVEIIKL